MGFPIGNYAGSRVATPPAYVHDGIYTKLIEKQGDYATWKGVHLEFKESWDWIIPVMVRLYECIETKKDTFVPSSMVGLPQVFDFVRHYAVTDGINTVEDAYKACLAIMEEHSEVVKVRTLVAMLENGPGVIPEGIKSMIEKEGYKHEKGKFFIEQVWSQAQDDLTAMYGIYGQGLVTEIGNWCNFEKERS